MATLQIPEKYILQDQSCDTTSGICRFDEMVLWSESDQEAIVTENDTDFLTRYICERCDRIEDKISETTERTDEILRLQKEIDKCTSDIKEMIAIRQNTKRIYYIGTVSGIIGVLAGYFFNVIPIAIAGVGIIATGAVGIWEARKYGY